MSEHTPTTDEVRRAYAICRGGGGSVPEFDRWLAEVERAAAARALEDAARDLPATQGDYGYPAALRARAAEIRERKSE